METTHHSTHHLLLTLTPFLLLTLTPFLLLLLPVDGLVRDNGATPDDLETYIIEIAPNKNITLTTAAARKEYYLSFIPKTLYGGGVSRLVYPYTEVFNGFAARLTKVELEEMKKMDGFVRAIPDRKLALYTTRTPAFLGLMPGEGLYGNQFGAYGEGVVIGLLDSGFTPGHPSFNDEGMPPPPVKFRGRCDSPVYCNNKVIGARSFTGKNVVDVDGHGTHTASTAAGSFVPGASILGLANGTASGIAPRAHLSIYKVCQMDDCFTSDILAGMDAAVADCVDVLSISLGSRTINYYNDPIAMGAFAANRRGILVSCSAGNDGVLGLSNDSPWILTVGASTFDRRLRVSLVLGDDQALEGESAYQPAGLSPVGPAPLTFPGFLDSYAAYCERGSLDGHDVYGKIVVCLRGGYTSRIEKGQIVKAAGGAGMIIANLYSNGDTILAEVHVLPAVAVSYADYRRIRAYMSATATPQASIVFRGTELGTRPAPVVAAFSAKGPSNKTPLLLKPDVVAPGVNVLAAYPHFLEPGDFNVLSGTSMSAPHVSGIAALLRASRPDLLPSAIKSAIITTTYTLDNTGVPIRNEHNRTATVYETGAGHVDPNAAAGVGLVYETEEVEYVRMMCGLGYSDYDVGVVVGEEVSCATVGRAEQYEVNYPSITVPRRGLPVTVRRTVTNVAQLGGKYLVHVEAPKGVRVEVGPRVLRFARAKEKKSFNVTFHATTGGRSLGFSVGSLWLVSDQHVVRSLLVAYA